MKIFYKFALNYHVCWNLEKGSIQHEFLHKKKRQIHNIGKFKLFASIRQTIRLLFQIENLLYV